jgi:hypothetical protein
MKKLAPVNYVNNAELLRNLVAYKALCEEAVSKGEPVPSMPYAIGNFVGLAILQISERLATKHNFNGYTFREEMVGDGILAALKAVPKFDPERSQNPFAYFTQVIFNAFVKRINIEKQERSTRNELMFFVDTETFENDSVNSHTSNTDNVFLMMNS